MRLRLCPGGIAAPNELKNKLPFAVPNFSTFDPPRIYCNFDDGFCNLKCGNALTASFMLSNKVAHSECHKNRYLRMPTQVIADVRLRADPKTAFISAGSPPLCAGR